MVLGVASVAVPQAARTDVAVLPLSGIGTQLGSIDTRVESRHAFRPNADGRFRESELPSRCMASSLESDGAEPASSAARATRTMPTRCRTSARWPQHGGGQLLVAYYHGGPLAGQLRCCRPIAASAD